MSYEDHSEDVASDFRDALEGLTMNSRVEITTLTVIARENTEYAHGISEVLQDHIKKVTPARKLPALYLLDSIVKNVGTPYTIYFSRGLYATFMNAYASVDNGTRRKMDEMLKTWKEPVPGSVDPRPVFAPDTVRPIENALIKARTSALQAQQEHMRSEQQLLGRGRPHSTTPYRETPTPPGGRPVYPPQAPYGHQQQQQQQPPPQQAYQLHPPHPTTQTTPQPPSYATANGPFQPPTPQLQQQQQQPQTSLGPFGPPAAAPRITLESLNGDVERLIQATKAEFAEKPYDASVAERLKALLDLQMILKSQNLEYDKLVLVRNQIDALAVNLPGHLKVQGLGVSTPTPPAAGYPPYQPPPMSSAPTSTAVPSASQPLSAALLAALAAARSGAASSTPVQNTAAAPPGPPTAVSLDSLFGKGALAAIMAARQPQQPQQPPLYVPPTPHQQQQPLARPALAHSSAASGLAASLQASLQAAYSPAASAATVGNTGNTGNPQALMDMLRKAGILQQTPTSGAAGMSIPQAPASTPAPVSTPGLANIIASIRSPAFGVREPLREIQNEISFQSASLKQFRPHLLPLMYEDLGPPCTQCGRRFRTDDAGRAAKTAHMDWHFRVHQRIAEAEKRGQHRSWYVDQADWIHSREALDSDGVGHGGDGSGAAGSGGGRLSGAGGATGAGGANGAGSAGGKVQWIPVPAGSASTNQVCPICQEKFEMKWLDEAQEWVWIDAVKIGSRVYHASCHAEATRGGNNRDKPAAAAMAAMMTGGAPATSLPIPTGPAADRVRHQHSHNAPEPILGKRKAEDGSTFHGNGAGNNGNNNNNNNNSHRRDQAHGGKNSGGRNHPGGRKKKRGGPGGGGGPRRPPDLDRVDPDIGGGGAASGDGAGGGRFHGRNGTKHRGGGLNDSGNSEDAKVDLNALPY